MYKNVEYPPMTLRDSAGASAPIKEGQSVKVLFPNGNIRSFKIFANPDHAAPESGIISVDSPLGHALLGRTAGEEVKYAVGKRLLKVKVLGVE